MDGLLRVCAISHDPFPVEVQTCLQPVELEQVLLPLFLFPAHGWWSWVPLLLGEPCRGSWGVTLGTGLAPSPSATKGVLPILLELGVKAEPVAQFEG